MAYIGTSPRNGVRRVHTYTATAGQEIFTGSSTEGVTLTYADTNYIDVFQNGVLLGSADYTSTSGTSVVLAQGASVSDLVVIVVYDVFSVADTVSKTAGGTFDGGVTVSGAFTSQGIDDNATSTAITIDSSQNTSVAGDLTIPDKIIHDGDTNTAIRFPSADTVSFETGGVERMRIHSNGEITQGTSAIDGTGGITFAPNADGDTGNLRWNKTSSSATGAVIFFHSGSTVGSISYSSSSVTYGTSSDHRLKENVTADWDATTRLKQLNPVRFNFISDADTTVDGFLAHEVQSVVPEAITGTHNEVDADGNAVMQGIDQSKLVPLLVKTIQEVEARITALENA